MDAGEATELPSCRRGRAARGQPAGASTANAGSCPRAQRLCPRMHTGAVQRRSAPRVLGWPGTLADWRLARCARLPTGSGVGGPWALGPGQAACDSRRAGGPKSEAVIGTGHVPPSIVPHEPVPASHVTPIMRPRLRRDATPAERRRASALLPPRTPGELSRPRHAGQVTVAVCNAGGDGALAPAQPLVRHSILQSLITALATSVPACSPGAARTDAVLRHNQHWRTEPELSGITASNTTESRCRDPSTLSD